MNRFRTALILTVAGFAAKGAAVVVYRMLHPPILLCVLTTYDPLAVHFANAVLPLFFDLRGISPPAAAPVVFEVLLVVGFAVQCFILGLAIGEVRRLFRGHRGTPPDSPLVVG